MKKSQVPSVLRAASGNPAPQRAPPPRSPTPAPRKSPAAARLPTAEGGAARGAESAGSQPRASPEAEPGAVAPSLPPPPPAVHATHAGSSSAARKRQRDGDGEAGREELGTAARAGSASAARKRRRGDGEAGRATVGGGGCVAHALRALGVFEDAGSAAAALDEQIGAFWAKRRAEGDAGCPRASVGAEGDYWSAELVGHVVVGRGFHFKKLALERRALDLAATLRGGGGFLLDGVLNKSYLADGVEVETDPDDPTDPKHDEARWRHAVAVVGGEVREQLGQRVDLRWLWLDAAGNQPDLAKGYLRKLLKVYRVERCRGGVGCKGTCLDGP